MMLYTKKTFGKKINISIFSNYNSFILSNNNNPLIENLKPK